MKKLGRLENALGDTMRSQAKSVGRLVRCMCTCEVTLGGRAGVGVVCWGSRAIVNTPTYKSRFRVVHLKSAWYLIRSDETKICLKQFCFSAACLGGEF